eukprot:TRINITY_DN3184_c0_g1_i7.p1 TRINITY_DN3184_c0_g1~~TRINITY_DN3184_c0_g1_i7.p1  ORF type:complete len:1811 (+),score=445.59 TRINITY_DN3184_c0_g1_i7:572-5434(+)
MVEEVPASPPVERRFSPVPNRIAARSTSNLGNLAPLTISSFLDGATPAEGARQEVFKVFPVSESDLNPGVINRIDPLVDKFKAETQLLVEDIRLELNVGIHEPFFLTIALYDSKNQTKLSEDFHIVPEACHEFFAEKERSHFEKRKPLFGIPLGCGVDYENFAFLVKVYKPFKSSKVKDSNLYMKGEAMSEAEREILMAHNRDILLSSHTISTLVPFMYGTVPIFNELGRLQGAVVNPIQQSSQMASPSSSTTSQRVLKESPSFQRGSGREAPTKITRFKRSLYLYRGGSNWGGGFSLESAFEPEGSKRTKAVPGQIIIELQKLTGEPRGKRLTPTQEPVLGVSHSNLFASDGSPYSEVIQEVQMFEAKETSYHHHYINTLYVYPESLGIKATAEANIQVGAQFLSNDYGRLESDRRGSSRDISRDPLDKESKEGVIYSKYWSGMTPTWLSAVSIGNKHASFQDEIKIRLPLQLTKYHHILFTFYNVTIKRGNKIINVLGHAVLPLYEDCRVLEDKRHMLPISKGEFPDTNYLSSPDVKWSKEKKFSVRTKLHSSVYTQNQPLAQFFNHYWQQYPAVSIGLVALRGLPAQAAVQFLPVLMNCLFQTLVKSNIPPASMSPTLIRRKNSTTKELKARMQEYSEQFGEKKPAEVDQSFSAFVALVNLLKELDVPAHQHALRSYVHYLFQGTAYSSKYLFEELGRQWLTAVEMDHPCLHKFKSHWFLFDLIFKSMVLQLYSSDIIPAEPPKTLTQVVAPEFVEDKAADSKAPKRREFFFSQYFVTTLSRLLPKLLTQPKLDIDTIVAFPLFFNNLLSIMDRGVVFKIIHQYLQSSQAKTNNDMKEFFARTSFLRILSDYENYVPLNLPLDLDLKLTSELSDISSLFLKRHFIAGTLVHELGATVDVWDRSLREPHITILRNIFRKHELDSRYGGHHNIMTAIAGTYFPFLLVAVHKYKIIKSMVERNQVDPKEGMAETEVQKWQTCFLWMLKYTKPSLLKRWWKKETLTMKENVLAWLKLICLGLLAHDKKTDSQPTSSEPHRIILSTLVLFVHVNTKAFTKRADHPLIPLIFDLLKFLMGSSSDSFLTLTCLHLRSIITICRKCLFLPHNTTMLRELTYDALRLCDSLYKPLRVTASGIFYILLKSNYLERGNIRRLRHLATVAFAKFLGSDAKKHYTELLLSLGSLKEESHRREGSTPDFQEEMIEVLDRLSEISKYEKTIAHNWVDEEMTADIYVDISDDYRDSPDLRLTWLDNLAVLQVQNGNIDEAVQCKITIAFTILQYLQWKTPKLLPVELRDPSGATLYFSRISPNLSDLRLPAEAFAEDEAGSVGQTWSIEGILDLLEDSVTLLKRESRYQQCLDVMLITLLLLRHRQKYELLLKWSDQHKAMTQEYINTIRDEKEIFSRYYRITFYGRRWFSDVINPHNSEVKSYIYKKKFKLTIGDVAKQLMKIFNAKFSCEVVNLPNNKEVDPSSLDPNQLYFQIVAVQPYFVGEDPEAHPRDTFFERNFNISRFISEVPFMSGGGKFDEGDVSRHLKKKTIYTTGRGFPHLTSRIEIVSIEHVIADCLCVMRNRTLSLRLSAPSKRCKAEWPPSRPRSRPSPSERISCELYSPAPWQCVSR